VKAAIDAPERLRSSMDIGLWVGLKSGRRQSGGDRRGRLHHPPDDAGLRSALYPAATVMMHHWLKAWGLQVARRRGMQRVVVAMARWIGVILYRMWVDRAEVRFVRPTAAGAD
jgi:transposase